MASEKNQKQTTVLSSATPNPHSMKFSVNHNIAEEHWETENIQQAGRSPLAQKILGFPWATKVFIGPDFITITKEDWLKWDTLTEPLCQMIKEHITAGEPVLYPHATDTPAQSDETKEEDTLNPGLDDSPVVRKIKQILKRDIQPAVALDGGFISFAGFKKGVVFLKMKGACSGCPSSTVTLKQGIETHLKNQLSEVREVVAL